MPLRYFCMVGLDTISWLFSLCAGLPIPGWKMILKMHTPSNIQCVVIYGEAYVKVHARLGFLFV